MMRARLLIMTALFAGFVELVATQSGQVSGTVQDTAGGEMPGVTVTVTGPQLSRARSNTSDARGKFALTDLPSGKYVLTFSLEGFEECRDEVSVTADGRTITDVVLRLKSMPPRKEILTCSKPTKKE